VDSGFSQQHPVRVVADDHHRRALDAGLVAGLKIDHVALEPAPLGPPQVHPEQHLCPVLRLGTAGPWMDRHDGILSIVLAITESLAPASTATERSSRLRRGRRRPAPCFGPFDEDGEIVRASPERPPVAIL
jgi:hypothetical protein